MNKQLVEFKTVQSEVDIQVGEIPKDSLVKVKDTNHLWFNGINLSKQYDISEDKVIKDIVKEDNKLTITFSNDKVDIIDLNHNHTFSQIKEKPTTISGYGITDAYNKTQSDSTYAIKEVEKAIKNITVGGSPVYNPNGITIPTITGEKGPKGDKGEQGIPGKDGVSPTLNVSWNDTGDIVTINDQSSSSLKGPQGPKGAQGKEGVSPLLRVGDTNKLEVSYNEGKIWRPISEYIAAWFRWKDNKIQISRDNQLTWENLSDEFLDNLRIQDYVETVDKLPTNASLGSIYMVGPDSKGKYRLHVNSSTGWIDNGEFAGLSVGVVQKLGQSITEVPSQKLLSDELENIYNSVQVITEEEYNKLGIKNPSIFYFTYEED